MTKLNVALRNTVQMIHIRQISDLGNIQTKNLDEKKKRTKKNRCDDENSFRYL